MKKLILFVFLVLSAVSVAAETVDYNDGVYHIVIDKRKDARKLDFVTVDELETNKYVHDITKSVLTINAGYFDPVNKKTISYINSKTTGISDPLFNEALIQNPVLNRNLDKILNRTEFRVLECENNKYYYEIEPHNASIKSICSIVTSAQGGPEIYPRLRLEEEFFVVKDDKGNIIRESCSVLHRTARTIIGLKDGDIHIFIFTNKHPVTLIEASKYVESLGIEKAMAFDGGSSTSLDYKKSVHITSTQSDGEDTGRKLKSFMILKK